MYHMIATVPSHPEPTQPTAQPPGPLQTTAPPRGPQPLIPQPVNQPGRHIPVTQPPVSLIQPPGPQPIQPQGPQSLMQPPILLPCRNSAGNPTPQNISLRFNHGSTIPALEIQPSTIPQT